VGIPGVVEAYHNALRSVRLWGPTNVAPIINHVARFAEQAASQPNSQVGGSYCKSYNLLYVQLVASWLQHVNCSDLYSLVNNAGII